MRQGQSVKEKKGFSCKNLIWNGSVILLCAILFLLVLTFVSEIADYQNVYTADEGTLIREVTAQQYDVLVENAYRSEALGVPVKGDMEQIYAVAHYYEAAMLYHVHKEVGNEQQAQQKYDQMLEYEKRMGEYVFAKEEIEAILGVDLENLK